MEIARVPTMINKTLTTAGVEESEVIETDVTRATIKAIQIKSRSNASLQYGFVTGGPYTTIPAGQTYWRDDIQMWVLEIFLVPSVNGQVAEIEVWR